MEKSLFFSTFIAKQCETGPFFSVMKYTNFESHLFKNVINTKSFHQNVEYWHI